MSTELPVGSSEPLPAPSGSTGISELGELVLSNPSAFGASDSGSLADFPARPRQTRRSKRSKQKVAKSVTQMRVTPESEIDTTLVTRFVKGDESAFVEIMSRYREKIFIVTNGLLRNHADAEEITQDTFIRAHRALPNFRGDSSLATWLYRIAVNLSRNRYWYFFRRRRQDALSLDCPLGGDEGSKATFSDVVADEILDPSQEASLAEFSVLTDLCMERLDARHREILVLRNMLERSYEEIGDALGINIGTVKSRIARARMHLRKLIAEARPELTTGDSCRITLDCRSGRSLVGDGFHGIRKAVY